MKKKKNKKLWLAVFIIALVVFICALTTLIITAVMGIGIFNHKVPDVLTTDFEAVSETDTEDTRPENPVDFASLKAINEDIYAWISMPYCEIEYPIIQPYAEDDLYYLRRNIYGEYEFSGTIFTEKLNSRDFSDCNTVIYGHNMLDGTMFSNLLKFKDTEFFNANEYIYIYTPNMKYTYRIFSAYQYDDRHLLNSFDLNDEQIRSSYYEEIQNPKSIFVNTRQVGLTLDSKIITLSTCTGVNWESRYLVQGVLISSEQTRTK